MGEGDWRSLSRKIYPGTNDIDGIDVSEVLDMTNSIAYANNILSTGVDEGNSVVLYYTPQGSALNRIPAGSYYVNG